MTMAGPIPQSGAPLFVLSFRQRDELAATAARGRWRVVAGRRSEGIERRFGASGARVAIVDARGALEDGLAAIRALAPVVQRTGAALLALLSRGDAGRLDEVFAAGATHFLVSPVREAELLQAIRFAERHAERVGGEPDARSAAAGLLGWRYDPAARSLQLTPGLAALLGLPEEPGLRRFLRRLLSRDRAAARQAFRRLDAHNPSTAFAHDLSGLGRVVEHAQFDPRTGRYSVLVESLGSAPDAGAALREEIQRPRDARDARRWIDHALSTGGAPLGLILVTIEGIEAINTAHGRAAGDAVLRTAMKRIGEVVRAVLGREALIARMGVGQTVIAGRGEVQRYQLAAGQIEEALSRPVMLEDAIIPVGGRVRLEWSRDGDTASSLLMRAGERGDSASPHSASPKRPLNLLAKEVNSALHTGQVALRFQPQVAIATGQIVGVEALARWNHPSLGELGAETLFAAAERAGVADRLSAEIQKRALRTAAGWPEALASLRLSINITAEDVAEPGFADRLLGRIDESGFPRGRLTLEITETGLMEDLGAAASLLSELRMAGCRVAIDDFGTGYSSLAYLKALPLDYLKIDKKLAQDITGTPRDRIIVRGVIDMARSLGLAVIAEGVETGEQLDLLAAEGCQYYQGYLCAGPLTLEELAELVAGASG